MFIIKCLYYKELLHCFTLNISIFFSDSREYKYTRKSHKTWNTQPGDMQTMERGGARNRKYSINTGRVRTQNSRRTTPLTKNHTLKRISVKILETDLKTK